MIEKSTFKYRWMFLIICVWINLCAWYCFDHPAALHNTLKDHFIGSKSEKYFEVLFGGLYGAYACANVFLPYISGDLRDKRGDRFVLKMMTFLLLIGQSLFVYGTYLKSFFVMYVGRIFLGWGIESVLPTQTSFITPYFEKDHLSFAISMNGFFGNMGALACMGILPLIARHYGLLWGIATGVLLNFTGFICAFIVTNIDKRNEGPQPIIEVPDYNQDNIIGQEQQGEIEEIQDDERGFLAQAVDFRQIFNQSRLFWFVTIYYAFLYSTVSSFTNVSVGLLSEKWLVNHPNQEVEAGKQVALYVLLNCALSTPIFGVLIDRLGHRAQFNILASLFAISGAYTIWYIHPLWGMILIGLAFALSFATVWSSIIFIADPRRYGHAFATVVSFYNLFFSISPIVVGILRNKSEDYRLSINFIIFLGVMSLAMALLIMVENIKSGYQLDGKKNNNNIPEPNNNLQENKSEVKITHLSDENVPKETDGLKNE